MEPALGLIELRSIAKGMSVVDSVVKKAPVQIRVANPISPGHFVLVFSGGVAEVEESFVEGLHAGGDTVLGQVFLPAVHESIPLAIAGRNMASGEAIEALAILETFTLASTILAADVACKTAPVSMVQMRLGQGLGGKAFFVLTGELHDVEASVEAAQEKLGTDAFQEIQLIPRPHPEMLRIYE